MRCSRISCTEGDIRCQICQRHAPEAARRYGTYHWRVSTKPKVQVAREHLTKAQEEAAGGDPRDALQWGFASLEAAIDALAAARGIAIDEKHWKRTEAARNLHATGVLPEDLSGLHRSLNEARKAVFYEGDEPDLGEVSIGDVLSQVEDAVVVAEAEIT